MIHQSMGQIGFAILILVTILVTKGAEYTFQVFRGQVYGGNYTYYRLGIDGNVILILESLEGDCDLYISQNRLQPTFDLDEHCLQSTTCGTDHISIPASFRRPVGIGVYGHPSQDINHYELKVLLDDTSYADHYNYYSDDSSDYERRDNLNIPPPHTVKSDAEESVLWTLFVGILRLILEVLTL